MSDPAGGRAAAAAGIGPKVEVSRNRVLATLTACHSINDFYAMVVPPLLPALREAFALSYTQAGALPFVSTGLSALLQPSLGYAADRRGIRKPLMIGGFLVLAVASVLIGQTGGYVTLLLAAAVLGLGQSTYHPQSATFLTYHFRQGRGLAQGIHGIGNGVGFIVAPILVTVLAASLGWRSAVTLLAIPALFAAALVYFLLREPEVRGHQGFLAGVTRPLLLLMFVNGFALASTSGFMTWLPSFYRAGGQTLVAAGALTAAMSAATLIAQPFGGTLSDRLGRRTVIVASLATTGVLLAAFVAAPALELMVLLSVLIGFCSSLLPPVTMVYATELAAGERSGMAVGIVWGLGTALSAFSPLVTGAAIDALGFGTAFLGLAVVAVVAAGLASLLPRRT